jgi:hypothetical protein
MFINWWLFILASLVNKCWWVMVTYLYICAHHIVVIDQHRVVRTDRSRLGLVIIKSSVTFIIFNIVSFHSILIVLNIIILRLKMFTSSFGTSFSCLNTTLSLFWASQSRCPTSTCISIFISILLRISAWSTHTCLIRGNCVFLLLILSSIFFLNHHFNNLISSIHWFGCHYFTSNMFIF